MSSGRLERETIEFEKIEKKLKFLPNIFFEYYHSLRAEKKSFRTIGEYIGSVRHFMNFQTHGRNDSYFYKTVTPDDISNYLASLETKIVGWEVKPTTSGFRACKWKALDSFFEFLVDSGRIQISPVTKKARPKQEKNTTITYLTPQEITSIINNIEFEAKITMVNRDLSIFMLGVTTGLHVSTILQLNIEDVDIDSGSIHVIQSENKVYDVFLGEKLKRALRAWIDDRELYFGDADTNALFISQYGKRISYDAVRKLLMRYSEGATDKKITPECLRHTCAMNLYEKTGDLNLTSAQLHHANINSTVRYAENANQNLKAAISVLDDML